MSENPGKPPKRSSATTNTIIILMLAGILYLGWRYLAGDFQWQQPLEEKDPQITWLEKETDAEETSLQSEVIPPKAEPATLHLTPGESQPSPAPQNECLLTADKIFLFFEHLDRQNYIREFVVKGSSLDYFKGIITKLIANPPVVVRETDDLFAILNNMAHFFRILGPKDILLIKDVLIHERELIEPTMALFYKWSEIAPECTDTDLDIELPFPDLYEYAGYFINTLGGQSYLFRRELYIRVLIRYYSTLIIDRANSMDENRYGIDIRYTLDSLISEIEENATLENRQEYLEKIIKLQENYHAKYGSR